MDDLYTPSTSRSVAAAGAKNCLRQSPLSFVSWSQQVHFSVTEPGMLSVFTLDGRFLRRQIFASPGNYTFERAGGCLVVQFKTVSGNMVSLVAAD